MATMPRKRPIRVELTPAQSLADRRSAALHEASHAVLAERFGGRARPHIWPHPGGDAGTRSWAGTCNIYADVGSIKPHLSMPGVIDAPSNALALVGLAGVAAELYDVLRAPDAVFFELQALLELDELSLTDRALVGDDVPTESLEQVINYVIDCWNEIEEMAAHLERFPDEVRPTHLM